MKFVILKEVMQMFMIENYIMAESLEQAYELNQSKRNVILGGTLWLKMSKKRINMAIDLSSLGLNTIDEEDDCFKIGCMCTLRDIEVHKGLNNFFNHAISKSVENIVGVQLRNGATVGGTIFSRFGFSDVLTALLALNTYVELFKNGIVPLADFINMPHDNDILVRIIIKKDNRKVSYLTHRKSVTDFPVLTCAVSYYGEDWNIVLGARPGKAKILTFTLGINPSKEEIYENVKKRLETVNFGTNYRGSKEYRQILAEVLIKRNIEEILSGGTHVH